MLVVPGSTLEWIGNYTTPEPVTLRGTLRASISENDTPVCRSLVLEL